MYQDLSFMKIPLPEDVLKLKNYGDFDGAQKMIQHFLSKDIPMALRKRLEIESEIIRVVGTDEYPYSENAESSSGPRQNHRNFLILKHPPKEVFS